MRITTSVIYNTTVANLQKHNARLLRAYAESSSGLRLHRPSDDPAGTRQVLALRDTLASLDAFKTSRAKAQSLLQGTETALQDTEALLLRAKALALRALNDTLGPAQRAVIAQEVGGLFDQALALGNSVIGGQYLFAGQATSRPPFVASATLASTVRSATPAGTLAGLEDDDLTINGVSIRATRTMDDPLSTVDAAASARAIAAAINEVAASTGVQATAAPTTRSLSVLYFGDLAGNALTINGVPVTGTITDAASLVAAVNAAGIPGVFAASGAPNNLTLTAPDGRNIELATDGSASSGIEFFGFHPGGGVALRETTTGVVLLSSEAPFTLGGRNPGNAGFTAGPVNLTAHFQGDNQTITQAIGTGQTLRVNVLASQFLAADLQPAVDRSTPLASLRQGRGITPGSIAITDRAGNTVTVDVSSAITVGDVIDLITAAPGVDVTATVNDASTGITIVDNNTAPRQNLSIADVAGGTTARELGLVAHRPGAVVGAPLAPQLTLTTPLHLLYGGRGVGTLGSIHITNGDREVDIDLSHAATIGEVLATITTSTARVQATLNASGTGLDVRSVDPTTVAIVTEVGSGQTAAALGIQGGNGIVKTLSLLQEALQKNDTRALNALLTSLDEGLRNVSTLQADMGMRSHTLTAAEETEADLALHVTELLAAIQDSDIAEVLTRLTQLNTGLQAALASTARISQTSLLDFLR